MSIQCTCAARVTVVVCMCVSVKSHFTSGASVNPESTIMYSLCNGSLKVFSETALLRRCSTPFVENHTIGHFPAESAHSRYSKESKNISTKMLKDVGMTVPKSRETSPVDSYMQQHRG